MKESKKVSASEALEKGFEHKDRVYKGVGKFEGCYRLKLSCADGKTRSHGDRLLWFDEGLGYERSLVYAVNQRSIFKDEQEGEVHQEPVFLDHGMLMVPKEKRSLQKLLSLYHPWNADIEGGKQFFRELKPDEDAKVEIASMQTEAEALSLALSLSFEDQKAVARPVNGSSLSTMSPEAIKHIVLLFAKQSPADFIEAVNSDSLELLNTAYESIDYNIAELTDKNRIFKFVGNSKPLFKIPLGEDPFEAISVWFRSDEGAETMAIIKKKIKGK